MKRKRAREFSVEFGNFSIEEEKTSRNLHKMKLEFEAVSLVEASLCV